MKVLCYLLNKLLNAVMLETLHLLTSLQLSCNTVVYKELIDSQLTKEHSYPRAWIQIGKHPQVCIFRVYAEKELAPARGGAEPWLPLLCDLSPTKVSVIHSLSTFTLMCSFWNVLNTVLHQYVWGDGLIIPVTWQGYNFTKKGGVVMFKIRYRNWRMTRSS